MKLSAIRVLVQSGTGVPPVNHAQDARATIKLHPYRDLVVLNEVPLAGSGNPRPA